MSLTAAQDTTYRALMQFARSGGYWDPTPFDSRIAIAAQGHGRAVAITTDGRPFKDYMEAQNHQDDLDMDAVGKACTGVLFLGVLSHDGPTCPIHEG